MGKKILSVVIGSILLLGACAKNETPTPESKRTDARMTHCAVKDLDGKPAESTGDFRVEIVNTQEIAATYVVRFDVRDAIGNSLAIGTIRVEDLHPGRSEIGKTDLFIGTKVKTPLKCSILEVE